MLYVLRTKLSVVCKAGLSIKKICIKFIFFKLNIMFYFYKKLVAKLISNCTYYIIIYLVTLTLLKHYY